MNPAKCDTFDYIHFLLAAQRVFTCTEAARSQPERAAAPAHDAFTRLLTREPPDTAALWAEAAPLIDRKRGLLVLDDTTLDKPYGEQMEVVSWHWSGKHRRAVLGINLLTLLWTDGAALIPLDARVYAKARDGLGKNEHFRALLTAAKEHECAPRYGCFDSWYSSLENLKAIREHAWHWLCRLKSNRHVNPDRTGNVALATVTIGEQGRVVHLKGYGMVRVFRIVAQDGDVEYWGTDDLEMTEEQRAVLGRQAWGIEQYHRGLKQCCGVERSQVRSAIGQHNHILAAIRAFLRLEAYRLRTGISWYEAKLAIIREAVRAFLAHPLYPLPSTA